MNRRANKKPPKRKRRRTPKRTDPSLSPVFHTLNITGQKFAKGLFQFGSVLTIEQMLQRGLVKLKR